MQRIKITPNLTSTSVTYLNNNGVTGVSNIKNPYTSAGCSGVSHCDDYTAVTKCLIDIYQGVKACQTIYILDKNYELVDLDKLEWIDLTIMNEFGCSVYWFSTREKEYYNNIEILQEKVNGNIFSINVSNWNNFIKNNVFDYTEDLITVNTDENVIELGAKNDICEIITNPISYNEKLYINFVSSNNKETIVVKANGSPNPVKLNENTELIILTGDDKNAILDILTETPDHIFTSIAISEINISTVESIKNKGAIRVCFEDYETMHLMPANLTGVLTFKFKDDKDIAEEDKGTTHVVSCIGIGRVYKNVNLDDNLETPIISHEIVPEHISYDNTKSGLQSTTMLQAVNEVYNNISLIRTKYEHYFDVCKTQEGHKGVYWDVCHMLDADIRHLIVTVKDTSGNIIRPTNIIYIGNNQINVWFSTYTKGFIYIQKQ